MLQINNSSPASYDPVVDTNGSTLAEALASLTRILRHQRPVLLLVLAASIILGLVYSVVTPASYTARATMVIDTSKVKTFQQDSMSGDATVDAGTVQTQVEVLKSQNISLAVIKELNLINDPEFTGPGSGLFGALTGLIANLFSSDESRSEDELTDRALVTFDAHRTIDHVGISHVIEIGFRSKDPAKAARIANAIANTYIADQQEAKYEATQRASTWLQARISEVRAQASTADKAVVDFKDKNNILNTGGRLMNEQQLSEINSQLILAHAATAEAKARYEQIKEVMKEDVPDGAMADALKSEVIIKLRNQYLALAGHEAIWSNKYGANHLATIDLRNQMQELRRNIADEMQKMAESYKNDLQIAELREQSIESSLAASISQSQTTNQAQVQLRELESNSQSYRSMYDYFLLRYMESLQQQQSIPSSEARLISPAKKPLKKSDPNVPLVMSVTVLGGLLAGFGVALFRELSDQVFRTSKQVEDILHVSCLSTLPMIEPASEPLFDADMPSEAAQIGPAYLPPIYRHAVEEPFSQFAEGLRSMKVALDLHGLSKCNKVIGITSTVPNEGKSVITANFAAMIAHSGARVLLIDADLRRPSLSNALMLSEAEGLVEVIANKTPAADAIWTDETTGMSFMPAGSTSKLLHTNEILRSPSLKIHIDQLREAYDYILIDFSPLAAVVDARTTTGFIDSYLYIVEWGRTKIEVVEQGLAEAPEVYERLLGVVLNKADTAMLARYDHYRGGSHQKEYYRRDV